MTYGIHDFFWPIASSIPWMGNGVRKSKCFQPASRTFAAAASASAGS